MIKKTAAWLTACLMLALFAFPIRAAEYQVEDTSQKIYDYAGLLSESEITDLESYADEISEKYKADFVVVTIEDNNRSSAQDFADRFFDDNYFGQKDGKKEYGKGDGMVFLIDMQNRDFALSTCGLLYKAMGDKDVEEFLDAVTAPMRDGNYYQACRTALEEAGDQAKSYRSSRIIIPIVAALVLAAIITAITLGIMVSFSKKSLPATEAGKYIVPGSLKISRKDERMTGTHTSVTPLPKDTGGGGGGSHKSSSGVTHGGGSRGF